MMSGTVARSTAARPCRSASADHARTRSANATAVRSSMDEANASTSASVATTRRQVRYLRVPSRGLGGLSERRQPLLGGLPLRNRSPLVDVALGLAGDVLPQCLRRHAEHLHVLAE